LRDRLVGIIAVVRPLADLAGAGRQGNTSWTFSEVQRNLQLCSSILRSLTGDPAGCNQCTNDGGCQSSRSGAKARSGGSVFEVGAVRAADIGAAEPEVSDGLKLQFPCSSARLVGCHDQAAWSHASCGSAGLVIGNQNGRRASMALRRVSHSMP
jgi:hypothetical protein